MAIDWSAALSVQAVLARKMSRTVLDALAKDGITIERVREINESVQRCAGSFDRVAVVVRTFDVDQPVRSTATAIEAIWANLAQITAERLRLKEIGSPESARSRRVPG
jgi:hypothetical protein